MRSTTSAVSPIRRASTATEMPAWPPPTISTSGSRSVIAGGGLPLLEPVRAGEILDVGCRGGGLARGADGIEIERGRNRPGARRAIGLAQQPDRAIARAVDGLEGEDRLHDVAPADHGRARRQPRPRRCGTGRRPPRPSAPAVRPTTVALPLKVAKCQEMPNRLRQWLSATKSRDNSARRPAARSAASNAASQAFRSFTVGFPQATGPAGPAWRYFP